MTAPTLSDLLLARRPERCDALTPRLERLLRGSDPDDVDAVGLNLDGIILRGVDIGGGVTLSRCDLRGADLRGADFAGAYIYGCNFAHADLRGARLRGAHFTGCDFTDAQLDCADLRTASGYPLLMQCKGLPVMPESADDGWVWGVRGKNWTREGLGGAPLPVWYDGGTCADGGAITLGRDYDDDGNPIDGQPTYPAGLRLAGYVHIWTPQGVKSYTTTPGEISAPGDGTLRHSARGWAAPIHAVGLRDAQRTLDRLAPLVAAGLLDWRRAGHLAGRDAAEIVRGSGLVRA
jgi:hypothetical protein